MSRGAIAAAVLAIAAAALALAGCGGSSPSASGLRRRATRVCQQALAQSDRISPPALPSGTAEFLRRGADVLGPEFADLRALRPPEDEAGSYAAALAGAARQLSILDGTIGALDRGADPLSAIKPLQRRLAPIESAENAAWRRLGIPACVSR